MNKQTALRVVDELAGAGCEKVSLSGGEPSLSPYWSEVAEAGTRAGMRMNMIVNGAHHDRAFVRRAKDARLVNLGVSLDGLEDAHDRNRRSPGLFRKVDKLLEDCAAEGLPIGVITTVWKGNHRDLPAMHDFLAGKVYAWQVQLAAAMGNLRRADQLVPEDLLGLVPVLANLVDRNQVNVHVGDNLGYFGPYEETIRKRRLSPLPCWVGCYAGCKHIGIQADGGVKGCLSLQSISATEGNLQQQSLADIWNRPGAFAYNRAFALDDLSGFCRTCVHAEICRGGCLSMRTCEGGRDNPFCYHRVATLAARKARKARSSYSLATYAPTALLALLGLAAPGCGRTTSEALPTDAKIANVDVYGAGPPDPRADAAIYGLAIPDARADTLGPDAASARKDVAPTGPEVANMDFCADLYGMVADLRPLDVPYFPDVYGLPSPDGPRPPDLPRDANKGDASDARDAFDALDSKLLMGNEVGNGDIYEMGSPPDGPGRIDGGSPDGADGGLEAGVTDGPVFNE
jgi:radical SAM protein with 4Fe4S-binding SPASM domain